VVAASDVAAKGIDRARMERNEARLVKLAIAHVQNAIMEIDIAARELTCLGEAQPCRGEKCEKGAYA